MLFRIARHHQRISVLFTATLALAAPASRAAERETVDPKAELARFNAEALPFLKDFCFSCHGNEKKKGGLNLQDYASEAPRIEDREMWEAARDMLQSREMPPENKPQPTEGARQKIVDYIDSQLSRFNCDDAVTPGRVTIRRLNRAEYNNTIRDLTGVDFKPAADFPADEVGYGFDNIGDVLSLSPILMEKYLAAAEQVATSAIVIDYPPKPKRQRIEAERMKIFLETPRDVRAEGNLLGMYREGGGSAEFQVDRKDEYRISIRAAGDQAGPEPPKLGLKIDDKEVKTFVVRNSRNKPQTHSVVVPLETGRHKISIAYLNNYVVSNHPDPRMNGDRNLFADYVDIIGPLNVAPAPPPASHALIIPSQPKRGQERKAAFEILKRFASRAYRRPARDAEVKRLTRFVDIVRAEGGNFNEGIQLAVQAALTSPHFLFRWELDPNADNQKDIRRLDSHQIACRLSYFLWSSMPDEELTRLAAEGRLTDKETIAAQAKRMLKDPKSAALVQNFAGQWLQIRNLDEIAPDPEHFPTFNDKLRASMKRETELFFEALVREDRSVLELLDSDFTFLDERLARHYGIDGVKGETFQRVSLKPEHNRGGVLTHASILTITSNPTRTSPVIRGKWIMEQILGAPPPIPPPGVPELEEQNAVDATASLRKRLEQHRANPDCAVCHNKLDPLGFALENFDGIGTWRDYDGKFPIDPAGELPSGERFSGPTDLKNILKSNEDFSRSLAKNMLTYALGRGLEYYDKCAVDDACKLLKSNDYRFTALVTGIVTSDPFLRQANQIDSE